MEETLSNRIAEFIKSKRIAKGLSQKQFAELIFEDDKHQPYIHKVENGRPISVITLDKILKKLGADIDIIEY